MREVFSFIFDKFTDPLTLPVEPLYEWVILGIIGIIAYATSFRIVRDMYDSGSICGGFLGSLFHWFIRLLIFVPIWFIIYWIIIIAQWVIANWMLALSILGGIILSIIAIVTTIHCINSRS